MNKFRAAIIVLLLMFFPLAITFIMSLRTASALGILTFLSEMGIAAIVLSVFFLLFLIILWKIPGDIAPYFVTACIFIYISFILGLCYFACYRAPDLNGLILNLSVIPNKYLLTTLWTTSAIAASIMFLSKTNKKALGIIFSILIIFPAILAATKELLFRHNVNAFFGNCREGCIIFGSTYTANKTYHAFSLNDYKFKQISEHEYLSKKIKSFSPLIYETYVDSYDRDDLSKIYVINKKTGQMLLLCAGENPAWSKEI